MGLKVLNFFFKLFFRNAQCFEIGMYMENWYFLILCS
jgi:hypothetical protein